MAGTFQLPSFDGQGEYIWANGNSFLGEFKIGFPNGYGVWKKQQKKADGEVHEGYFTNGKKDGIGITKFQNGNFFRGYYYKNKRQGYGEMNWIDKRCSYRGEWIDNKQSGVGILEFESEVEPYFGFFKDGVLEEIYDMEEKKPALDKLATMKQKLEEEIEKFKGESAKRGNISRILGETINSIYDKKLYDFGGKRPKNGTLIPNRQAMNMMNPPRDSHREDGVDSPRDFGRGKRGPGNQSSINDSLNNDLHKAVNATSNPRLQQARNMQRDLRGGRKVPSAGNDRIAERLPGIRDRPSEEGNSFQYHSFREDSFNPNNQRNNRGQSNHRDRSLNQGNPNQYRSIDQDIGSRKNNGGGKPFQFYKGRTTYLDRLITDKMKLHPVPVKKGGPRPILIKEPRVNKPIWKPSGINVVDNYNMGNVFI